MTKAVIVTRDKQVTETDFVNYKDIQAVVEGLIEAVELNNGCTMYVNEEFLFRFGPEDFNSIASDICGLCGRPDLMFSGILGNVLITGPLDDEGRDADIPDSMTRIINRVAGEAA